MAYSGEGNLIEGEIEGSPTNEVRPIVCDADGHLIIDLDASGITIGTVDQGNPGSQPWPIKIDQTGSNNDVDATITNFPASQAVTGTFFQAVQPVSGPLTDSQLRAAPVNVNGTFTPSGTQDVNIVGVANPVNVAGTFFQATQPVSVATLPLPAGASTETTLSTLNNNVAKEFGTWAYYAGTSGTVTISAGQRAIGIGCHSTTGGNFTINGGASVPIPANVGISIEPKGNIVAPTISFTNTDSYFVEAVS